MNKKIIGWIGLYLIIDAIISIFLASMGNITLTLANINLNTLFFLSQIGRLIRLGIGVYLFTAKKKNLLFVGIYLIIDSIWSIVLANEFNGFSALPETTRYGVIM